MTPPQQRARVKKSGLDVTVTEREWAEEAGECVRGRIASLSATTFSLFITVVSLLLTNCLNELLHNVLKLSLLFCTLVVILQSRDSGNDHTLTPTEEREEQNK